MKQLRYFLQQLDDAWKPLGTSRQELPLIGSGALMLLTDYERGTKDGDVFQTSDIGVDRRKWTVSSVAQAAMAWAS